jgi:hypothetical protein
VQKQVGFQIKLMLKGDDAMKKLGLGIAILLFAILFKLCSAGLDAFAFFIGLVGLYFAVYGGLSKSD